jgi:SAM-dependent methyltransferase
VAGLLDDDAPWRTLASGAANDLLAAAAACDPRDPKQLARLRGAHPLELVRAALEVVDARRRAAGRLEDASTLIADGEGVEQASRAVVAEWKARRFAGAGRVVDLCCGIGADARHLARVAETIGVEILPARRFMAERYARCSIELGDAANRAVGGEVVHIDPSRREPDGGRGVSRRAQGLADFSPGIPVLDRILREARGGALKLSPGVDIAEFPWRAATELEFVSDRGSLVAAIAWFGDRCAAAGAVRATCLPEGTSVCATDIAPLEAGDGTPRRFVYTVDPALDRTRLAGTPGLFGDADLVDLHAGLGVYTADAEIESPWLERFRVVASMPWREDRVRDWLLANDGGAVEVKTRGSAIEATAAQRALNGAGRTRYAIFALRLGKKLVAIVTTR